MPVNGKAQQTTSPRQSAQLADVEAAFLEHCEQVVRQIDIALVEFVYEKHPGPAAWQQCGPQRAEPEVVADVACRRTGLQACPLQVGLVKSADRVVFVQSFGQRRTRSDRPVQYGAQPELVGDGVGQCRLLAPGWSVIRSGLRRSRAALTTSISP